MIARFSPQEVQEATGGQWVGAVDQLPSLNAHGVCTDSRELFEGCIFLALTGERFDGHQYVECCAKAGALLAIVSRQWWEGLTPQRQAACNLPVLLVDNTLWAYMALGAYHRRRLEATTVIGLTGSSGKTTVKEGLFHLLQQLGVTQATEKNFNNDIGVTQTLLHIEPQTQYAICEMGMRGPGEIARLSRTMRPDLGLLLNVGPAHLGRLGSLEAIASAKCEIAEGLDPVIGKLIVNGDDPLLREFLPPVWQGQTIWVSEADVSDIQLTPGGCYSFVWRGHELTCPQPGRHSVMNGLLILSVALELGFPPTRIATAYANLPADPEGRWEARAIADLPGSTVINDAYNANPASMEASLTALSESLAGGDRRTVLVLGGMNELGDFSQRYHEAIGQLLVKRFPGGCALAGLVLVGTQEARWILDGIERARPYKESGYPVIHCSMATEVAPSLKLNGLFPLENTVYFLKGSRSYQLEKVSEALNSDRDDQVALSAARLDGLLQPEFSQDLDLPEADPVKKGVPC